MTKHTPDHAASVAVAVAGTDMSGAVAKVMVARYKAQRDELLAALQRIVADGEALNGSECATIASAAIAKAGE